MSSNLQHLVVDTPNAADTTLEPRSSMPSRGHASYADALKPGTAHSHASQAVFSFAKLGISALRTPTSFTAHASAPAHPPKTAPPPPTARELLGALANGSLSAREFVGVQSPRARPMRPRSQAHTPRNRTALSSLLRTQKQPVSLEAVVAARLADQISGEVDGGSDTGTGDMSVKRLV